MTYEQIAEMMEEMGLPFAYHHLPRVKVPHRLFAVSISWREYIFQRIIPCISVLRNWILNFIQTLRILNWKIRLKRF